MTPSNNVDLDLYGRAFDGIFGGAEDASRKQTLLHQNGLANQMQAEEAYIELDHAGRGQPRTFGPDAQVAGMQAAKSPMGQKQGSGRKMKLRALFFPAGKVGRKAKSFARKLSFRRRTAPADVAETAERIDNTPRRVKSKLASDEQGPNIEPATVARAIRSLNSISDLYINADSEVISSDVHVRSPKNVDQGAVRNDDYNDAGPVAHQLQLVTEDSSPEASDATNTSSEASVTNSSSIEFVDSGEFSFESDPGAVAISIDSPQELTPQSSRAWEEDDGLFEQPDSPVEVHDIALEATCEIGVAGAAEEVVPTQPSDSRDSVDSVGAPGLHTPSESGIALSAPVLPVHISTKSRSNSGDKGQVLEPVLPSSVSEQANSFYGQDAVDYRTEKFPNGSKSNSDDSSHLRRNGSSATKGSKTISFARRNRILHLCSLLDSWDASHSSPSVSVEEGETSPPATPTATRGPVDQTSALFETTVIPVIPKGAPSRETKSGNEGSSSQPHGDVPMIISKITEETAGIPPAPTLPQQELIGPDSWPPENSRDARGCAPPDISREAPSRKSNEEGVSVSTGNVLSETELNGTPSDLEAGGPLTRAMRSLGFFQTSLSSDTGEPAQGTGTFGFFAKYFAWR